MTSYKKAVAALLAVAAVGTIAACDKNARQDITAPAVGAFVKFYNFGVNAPAVNFYANTTKVTAISSTSCTPPADTTAACRSNGIESTTGTGYGSLGSGGFYNIVAPGTATLAGKIAAATDNGLAVASLSTTLEANKFYSYFVAGVYDATGKKADAFIVADPLPTVDNNNAYVRFVNASSNALPMTLYAKNTTTGVETALGSTVAYKAAGAFTLLAPGSYDLNTRTAGSSTNIATRTAVSFSAGRVYTIALRGDITLPSTGTATNRAFLDNTANR